MLWHFWGFKIAAKIAILKLQKWHLPKNKSQLKSLCPPLKKSWLRPWYQWIFYMINIIWGILEPKKWRVGPIKSKKAPKNGIWQHLSSIFTLNLLDIINIMHDKYRSRFMRAITTRFEPIKHIKHPKMGFWAHKIERSTPKI